jgi:HEAT repeat protein
MALLALGELGSASSETLQAVRRALNDSSAALRFQALVALHHLEASELDQHVLEKLSDPDAEVRFVALRIAEERLVGDGKECPKWLSDKLTSFSSDVSDCVRLLAAIVLHRAERTTDAEALVNAVNNAAGTREPEDEQAAIEIAGDLKLERAVVGLERRAFGWLGFTRDSFAWQAKVALAKMGHRRAVVSILTDLKAWTWEARTLAAAAAGAAQLVPARARLLAMLGDDSRANQETVRNALRQIDAAGSTSSAAAKCARLKQQ